MKITINGIVKAVQEPKTFASGFTVCDVLIEAGSNIYPVTFKKDDVDEALALVADHPITLECWLNSREWNGRYFVELKYAGKPEEAPAPARSLPTDQPQTKKPLAGRTTNRMAPPSTPAPNDLPF
jgi:hypothetical protein